MNSAVPFCKSRISLLAFAISIVLLIVLIISVDVRARDLYSLQTLKLTKEKLTASRCWDGTDNSGRLVATGIYLYRITAGDFTGAKKMVLLK